MDLFEQLRCRAVGTEKRVIFPEQSDPRVLEAIDLLQELRVCVPVALNEYEGTTCEVFWRRQDADQLFRAASLAYFESSRGKVASIAQAEDELRGDSLLLAAALVRSGYADTGVAGSIAATGDVLRACLRGIGLAASSKLLSSCFVIEHPYRVMTFGDCAVTPEPNSEQLAQIAVDCARTHFLLTDTSPKVAFLSFSTLGSACHASIDRIREAVERVRVLAPKLDVCGELQVDASLVPEVGAKKAGSSSVAGYANVLIFPDLNSGNIAYKIAERLGGAKAIGPVL
ncbi:MAG: phosphate acyltransferase, partial [Pseudomonadales bacterium]